VRAAKVQTGCALLKSRKEQRCDLHTAATTGICGGTLFPWWHFSLTSQPHAARPDAVASRHAPVGVRVGAGHHAVDRVGEHLPVRTNLLARALIECCNVVLFNVKLAPCNMLLPKAWLQNCRMPACTASTSDHVPVTAFALRGSFCSFVRFTLAHVPRMFTLIEGTWT
jgi:hypothetical protein